MNIPLSQSIPLSARQPVGTCRLLREPTWSSRSNRPQCRKCSTTTPGVQSHSITPPISTGFLRRSTSWQPETCSSLRHRSGRSASRPQLPLRSPRAFSPSGRSYNHRFRADYLPASDRHAPQRACHAWFAPESWRAHGPPKTQARTSPTRPPASCPTGLARNKPPPRGP